MALPAGVARLGTFKGDKGDTGTIAFATAETVPADQPAEVEMVGPPENRGLHMKMPRGLPGFDAVPTDEGIATLIAAADSQTSTALNAGRVATMNLRKVVTPSGVDDTAAVNAALAAFAADGGGKVIIPRDDWKYTGSTGLQLIDTTAPIHIEAEDGTVFDMTASTATIGMRLGGALTTVEDYLTADASAMDVTISCPIAVAPGDMIRIQSTDLFTPSLGTAVKGELAEVLSVSGSTIRLKSPLWDWYTAATTRVTRVKAPRVSVENLTILRDGTNAGLMVQYARDILLGGLYAEGARERLFAVSDVLGATLQDLRGRDFWAVGSGTSYGLSVSSSQEVLELGNNLKGGRHAVAHGGSFPVRDVQVLGGTYDNYHQSGQAAFDFHPNAENVRMVGVTVLNGIVSGASNFEATDCTVRTGAGTPRTAIELGLWQSSEYVKLRNMDIRTGGATSDAVHIINRAGAAPTTTKEVQVHGAIRAAVGGVGVRVSPATPGDTGATINRLTVAGDVRGAGGFTMQKSGAAEILTKELRIRDADVHGATSHGVTITTTGQERIVIERSVLSTAGAARAGFSGAAGAAETIIRNSRLAATGGNGDRNSFGTGRLEITDSSVDGFTANGGISAASASEALISNVQSINNVGAMGLPARHYSRKNAAGAVTTHGAAAPTTGTWVRGDRCENSAPAVGAPAGWVCTTGGTPGTWRALPNL